MMMVEISNVETPTCGLGLVSVVLVVMAGSVSMLRLAALAYKLVNRYSCPIGVLLIEKTATFTLQLLFPF